MPNNEEASKTTHEVVGEKKQRIGLTFVTHKEVKTTSPTGEETYQIFTFDGSEIIERCTTLNPRLDSWNGSPVKFLGGNDSLEPHLD